MTDFFAPLTHVLGVKIEDPRQSAFRILQRRENASAYIEELLAQESAGLTLTPADRGLLQELVYGVVRWQATLDWLIQQKTAGRTQKIALRGLLRLGLYQLFWLDRIPDHAAVNETVTLAKRLGYGPQSGFINAVLRGFLREREQTQRLLEELREQNPALAYSHPEWLFNRWVQRWDRARAIQLMVWNNQPPKTFARVNSLRITPAKLAELWVSEGVTVTPVTGDWIPTTLVYELNSHPPLAELPSFKQGLFYIQDPSTLLAVHALAPQPGEQVLDVCAAPGGKTTLMAQFMQDNGRIVAEDFQPHRVKLIEENCRRLGVHSVLARLTPPAGESPSVLFDRVLLDAPCSNTGVMRRRVDLRWRIRPEETGALAA